MEYKSNTPIYLQVIEDIKQKLLTNVIHSGDKLPSTRDLAADYKINPNTAARVYDEMEQMGICHTRRGLGTFVNEDSSLFNSLKDTSSKRLLSDFVDGMIRIGYTHDDILQSVTDYLNNLK